MSSYFDDFSVKFYDPLSTPSLTLTILAEFERQPSYSLAAEPPEFTSSGLYAIYYEGESVALYRPLAPTLIPVYVGQARSTNSATGKTTGARRPLWSRIRDHRRSIEGGDLPVGEFTVRLLAMPDVHIDLGENGLRVGYQPVWNSVLNGFGSHEQGPTTRKSGRSKWDTLHAGRKRTFGETKHDIDALYEKAREHIDWQVVNWRDRIHDA